MKKLILIIALLFISVNTYADQVGFSTQPVPSHNHTGVGDGGIIKPFYDNILSSATTTITISNLDSNANFGYRIEIFYPQMGTSSNNISFYINGDLVNNHYQTQKVISTGTSITASNSLTAQINNGINISANDYSYITGTFNVIANNLATGFFTCFDIQGGTLYNTYTGLQKKDAVVANITSITLLSSVSNGFGVGTRVRIWNLK